MKLTKGLTLLLATLITLAPAYAFGVSAPYWNANPLQIEPGQTKEFVLTLQNMADSETIVVKAEWVNNAGIAQFTGPTTTFSVPSGIKDILVPIQVTVPANAPIGTVYQLDVMFTTGGTGEGTVVMGTGVEKLIPVEVVSAAPAETVTPTAKTAGMSNTTMYIVLAIIVIIVFAIFFMKRKKA